MTNGILFPAIIKLKIIKNNNKIDKKRNVILFFVILNKESEKKVKKANLCKYDPAINSSPKGPANLLPPNTS